MTFYIWISCLYFGSYVTKNHQRLALIALGILSLLVVFLIETPLGGDFNSLASRANFNYSASNFYPVFNFIVWISNIVDINVSSIYSIISLFFLIVISFKVKKPFLILSPFIFIFLLTGFQRQGLAIEFIILGSIFLKEKKLIYVLIFYYLSFITHPSSAFFIIFIFFVEKFNLPLVFFSAGVVVLSMPYLADSNATLNHYYVHYIVGKMEARIWIMYGVMTFFAFILQRKKYFVSESKVLIVGMFVGLYYGVTGAASLSGRVLLFVLIYFMAKGPSCDWKNPEYSRQFLLLEILFVISWLALSDKAYHLWWF